MVRAVHGRQPDDLIREVTGRPRRLVGKHVESDPESLVADRAGQRGMIDDFAACGVDDDRAGFQPPEHFCVDQPLRGGVERQVHAEDVRARRDVGRRRLAIDPHLAECPLDARTRASSSNGRRSPSNRGSTHDRHPEAAARRITSRPMLPTPRRPIVLPYNRALEYSFLFQLPAASSATFPAPADPMRNHANASSATAMASPGTVRYVDAAPRGAGHVDGVLPRAGANDQGQPAGVEHRRGDLRPANHEHVASLDASAAVRSSSLRSGSYTTVQPPRQPIEPLFSNLSATRTFIG